ncbi:MAG TPA: tRNA pseudouridine synthase A [Oligoflexia bacterium]|nr:tRNA pseudouridine synthase A [Oligoflexia bacterium]HMP49680.1 tRNA pseudouridine synthase A [Oligoflexia bacterium]
MNIKLEIEYDGRELSGWQRQELGISTVQGILEDALTRYLKSRLSKAGVSGSDFINSRGVILRGASRTDAGVSAKAQVACFSWPEIVNDISGFDEFKFLRSINGMTPETISVISAVPVNDDFNPRRDAIEKEYIYSISFRAVAPAINREMIWHVPWVRNNINAMEAASRLFAGTHDFSEFRASDCSAKSCIRDINTSELYDLGSGTFEFRIKGNGFLKQMVRIIVGEIIDVGFERSSPQKIMGLLSGAPRPGLKRRCAPAYALRLEKIYYP